MARLPMVALLALLAMPRRDAHAASGALDPSFDGDGTLITAVDAPLPGFGSATRAGAVVYQPDGKLVVAGDLFALFGRVVLVRYLSDGSLDPTFGAGGIVQAGVPGAEITSLVLQPDGKLVAGGKATNGFLVVRFDPDGSLDPTFGTGGIATTTLATSEDVASALVLQPDGKIVAAGRADRLTSTRADVTVVRYLADGQLDPDFGSGGIVFTPLTADANGFDGASALVLQPDGKLVAAAGSTAEAGWGLVRYLPDGNLDPTFGTGGIVVAGSGAAGALALQPDGRLVVAGAAVGGMAVARFTPAGALDATFGRGGEAAVAPSPPNDTVANALALEPGGNIVVAGVNGLQAALARFTADGSLDPTFGTGGTVTTTILPNITVFTDLVREPGGRLVAVGLTSDGLDFAPSYIAVARYFGGDPCGDGLLGACCPRSPRPGCHRQTGPGKGVLRVSAASTPVRGRLVWQWRTGEATTVADAGDPVGTAHSHVLCVYDESSGSPVRLLELRAPGGGTCAGKPCWQAGADGLLYRDADGTPDGVEVIRLHAGSVGRGRVNVQARGGRVAGLTFPLPLPLRVQLQAEAGACWESTFGFAGVGRRDGRVLRAAGE